MDTQTWSQVEDHREDIVYSKAHGRVEKIKDLGPLPAGVTPKPKPSEWHNWDEPTDDWVEDTALKDDAAAEDARQQAIKASTYVTNWDTNVRGKTFAEIKTLYDGATQAQKSDLLFYLLLVRALEVKG